MPNTITKTFLKRDNEKYNHHNIPGIYNNDVIVQ